MISFLNHFAFEFKTGLRNQTSMLMYYLFPLLFYALMGLVMTKINPGFTDTLLPSMVLFAILVGTQLGMPSPLVEYREAGIFRSFKINGVPALSILSIPALTTIFHALIVSAVIALTAAPLFGGKPPASWANLIWLTFFIALVFAAIGALIGVVSTGSRSVVLFSQLIFLPSMLLGGLMMPFELLPRSVRLISGLLPTPYAMQALLGYAYHQETVLDPRICLIVLAAVGFLAFGLALYLFNWDSRNRSRRGHPLMGLLILLPLIAGIILA